MKKKLLTACVATSLLFMTSCDTKTKTGALTGMALGATTGAILEGQDGAAVGALIGTALGAGVGYAMDKQDEEELSKSSPETLNKLEKGQPLSLQDVIALSKAEVNDRVIMSQIEATNTQFQLSSSDIIYLKQNNVSQNVIDFMIKTRTKK